MKQRFKDLLSSLRWIYFISCRFAQVDRKGRSAVSGFLSSLGICFGVMTLIVIVSVMNGFQSGFIESLLEISSAHIRVTTSSSQVEADFEKRVAGMDQVTAVVPFYEAQSLLSGRGGKQTAALIRAVPDSVCNVDAGFSQELHIVSGEFALNQPNTIVLGWELARILGVRPGQTVNLFALSGSSDVELFSENRECLVTGVFQCGYAEINSSYAFVSLETGRVLFAGDEPVRYNIKLHNPEQDALVIGMLSHHYPDFSFESWRSYNRSFFGALRVEKNMLMLLVFLIFVVVGINIYNSMRRMVYERHEEIAVISALGGNNRDIYSIFIVRGVLTGIAGAMPGLLLGLLIGVQMEMVFAVLSKVTYWAQLFFCMLVSPEKAGWIRENPMFHVYAQIPARLVPSEILLITIFGVFSALIASWFASRRILELSIAEVLHDE